MSSVEERLVNISKNTVNINELLVKLVKILLGIIVILIITNCATAIYGWSVFNSYEYVTEVTTYQQDGNGINTYNDGTMGDIINGTNYNSDTKDIGKEK